MPIFMCKILEISVSGSVSVLERNPPALYCPYSVPFEFSKHSSLVWQTNRLFCAVKKRELLSRYWRCEKKEAITKLRAIFPSPAFHPIRRLGKSSNIYNKAVVIHLLPFMGRIYLLICLLVLLSFVFA